MYDKYNIQMYSTNSNNGNIITSLTSTLIKITMRNIMEKDVNFIKEFTSKLNLFGINAEQVIFLMESCGNIHRLCREDIDDLNAAEHKRYQDFLEEEEYNAYYHRLNNPEPDEEP